MIKIITGFGEDQKYSVELDEAHKAYYLFRNPEKRGVFSNGVALLGRTIQAIQPDWHAIMGWNPTHKMTTEDWAELETTGVKEKVYRIMRRADNLVMDIETDPSLLSLPLNQVLKMPRYAEISSEDKAISDMTKELTDGFSVQKPYRDD